MYDGIRIRGLKKWNEKFYNNSSRSSQSYKQISRVRANKMNNMKLGIKLDPIFEDENHRILNKYTGS